MPIRYPLIIIASLALMGSTAWAQPSLATPSQYQQATPEPAPEPAPRVSKFSMGVNFVGGALDNPENEFDVGDLSGTGVFARYRLSKRFEIEVAFDKLTVEMSNERVREIRPMSASILWHVLARGNTLLYLRAGLGKGKESYTLGGGEAAEFEDKIGHFGVGSEYRFGGRNLGVTVELRTSTVARVLDDGSSFRTRGGQVRLGGVYHF